MIFHHPTCANVNTCLIPIHPLDCAVHPEWCTSQPKVVQKWIYSLCVRPSCVQQNGSVSECYSGSILFSDESHWNVNIYNHLDSVKLNETHTWSTIQPLWVPNLIPSMACLHVPSPSPSPSTLHCVNSDRPFDGQIGFRTHSVRQMIHFHWHNVKLWQWLWMAVVRCTSVWHGHFSSVDFSSIYCDRCRL